MKNLTICFSLIIFLILASCKGKILSPAEADRSMKILNSNLVNLLSAGSEKPEFKALTFIMNQENCPFPFHKNPHPTKPDTSEFLFTNEKGIYSWNAATNTFEKHGDTTIVSLNFPAEKSAVNNTRLNLRQYENQAYTSRPKLPTLIDATIGIDGKEVATIRHNANITNNLPENIHTIITGPDYETAFKLRRTQFNKEGNLNLDFYLKTKGVEIISGKVDARIEYSRQGYFFKTISFYLKLIDHHVTGEINYSAIDPTSADYVGSFNSNSDIKLFEGRKQVGIVVLNKTNNNELLDYFIRFSNDDEILLSDYLPVLKKLLDLKY